MVITVGFVVEGASDKKLAESTSFQEWLQQDFGLRVIKVIDAGGNGNLCSRNITQYVELLRKQAKPNKVVVLADLDPEKCAPCIARRKELIGIQGIDLVIIARNELESWFLADTQAMRDWTQSDDFFEEFPEHIIDAKQRLREVGLKSIKRGFGNEVNFANKFIHKHGFSVRRAAEHPNCPSAAYFVKKLEMLAYPIYF